MMTDPPVSSGELHPNEGLRRAVVCASADGAEPAIAWMLGHAAFEILATVDRGIEILPAVAEYTPDVVVIDAALTGSLGWRLLRMVAMLAPEACIIVVSDLAGLDLAAVEAGAHAVVAADDIGSLRDVLRELTASSGR